LGVLVGAGSYHLQEYVVSEHIDHIQIVLVGGYHMQEYEVS